MAQFVIPIRDEDLKDEIEAAFASQFDNRANLSPEQLVIKHVGNHIRQILNEARIKAAREAAELEAALEESLE